MAVKVKETKLMLKSVFTDESSGVMKRRTVSIKGINPQASKENLYSLSSGLNLSLIHISEPTRRTERSRMPSSA